MKLTIQIDNARLPFIKRYSQGITRTDGKPYTVGDAVNDLLVTAEGRENALARYNAKKAAKKSARKPTSKAKKVSKS